MYDKFQRSIRFNWLRQMSMNQNEHYKTLKSKPKVTRIHLLH